MVGVGVTKVGDESGDTCMVGVGVTKVGDESGDTCTIGVGLSDQAWHGVRHVWGVCSAGAGRVCGMRGACVRRARGACSACAGRVCGGRGAWGRRARRARGVCAAGGRRAQERHEPRLRAVLHVM